MSSYFRNMVSYWDMSTINPPDIGWQNNGNDGTGVNLVAATDIVPGIGGGMATEYNGANQRTTINYDGDLDTNNNVTITIWSNPADVTTNQYVTELELTGAVFDRRTILLGYQVGFFNIFNNGYPTGAAADTQITAVIGEWQQIIYSSDGSRVYGYRNGELIIDVSANLNISAQSIRYHVASRHGLSNWLNSSLDSFGVFDICMTPTQAMDWYLKTRRGII